MALSPTDDNGAALRGHDRGDARRLRQRVAARGGGRAAAKSHSFIQRCHSALSFSVVIQNLYNAFEFFNAGFCVMLLPSIFL